MASPRLEAKAPEETSKGLEATARAREIYLCEFAKEASEQECEPHCS